MTSHRTFGRSERTVRGRRWRQVAAAVLVALLVCTTTAAAVPPPPSDVSPPPATAVTECTTIDTAGRYVLAADLRAPPDTDVCLYVRASDVRLRGDGHRIDGGGSGTVGVGVGSRAGVSNVTVSNVTASGWQVGVGFGNVDGGSVTDVEVRGNGDGVRLARSRGVRVTNVVAVDNDGAGVRVSDGSADSTVAGLTALGNRRGVLVERSTGTDVVDGRFIGNERSGVHLRTARDSTLRGNVVVGSGPYGVEVAHSTGSRFLNTTVDGPEQAGIEVTDSRNVTLVDGEVRDSGAHGVELVSTSGSLLRDVRVTGHRGVGIRLGGAPNNALRNLTVEGGDVGVFLSGSRSTDARHVTVVDTDVGVRLLRTDDSRLRDVQVREVGSTSYSEEPVGVHLDDADGNVLVNTTVRGDPGGLTSLGVTVEGGVANRFSTLTVTQTDLAVWLQDGRGHRIENATIERNEDPVIVRGTEGLSFVDVTARDNDAGVDLRGAPDARLVGVRVTENELDSNRASLELSGDGVRVAGSLVRDNDGAGLVLSRSNGSVVADTVVRGNAGHGLRLDGTRDTRVTNVTVSTNERDGVVVAPDSGDWRQDPLAPANNTLSASAVAENFGDGLTISDASDTTLRGVTVTNNRAGIDLDASPGTVVADAVVRANAGNGVSVADGSNGVTVAGVDVSRNAQVGLSVIESDGVAVTDTTVHRNFDDGIEVRRADRFAVESTDTTDNGWSGIYIESSRDVRVRNVRADGNRNDGIGLWGVEGWSVVDSVVTDNRNAGIDPTGSDDGAITENRVVGNDQGIWASGENNSYTDNVAARNDVGFLVSSSGRTLVRNNSAVENAEIGIRASGRAVVADNVVSANGAGVRDDGFSHGGVVVSNNVRVDGNRVVDNDGVGVQAREANVAVRDNHVAGNADAGVELVGTTNATVAGNVVSDNDHGVVVGFGRQSDRQGRRIAPSLATTIEDNVVENRRVNVLVRGGNDTRVLDNRLVDGTVGVRVEPITFLGPGREREATGVEVHGDLIADNGAFGVENVGGTVVNATENDWGASDGPSSPADPDAPFADPVTGTLADGGGDAVSENRTEPGVSNVRFDPYRSTNASTSVSDARAERAEDGE